MHRRPVPSPTICSPFPCTTLPHILMLYYVIWCFLFLGNLTTCDLDISDIVLWFMILQKIPNQSISPLPCLLEEIPQCASRFHDRFLDANNMLKYYSIEGNVFICFQSSSLTQHVSTDSNFCRTNSVANRESRFSQMHKIGNNGSVAIYVFPFICNFLLYSNGIMLVIPKFDITGYKKPVKIEYFSSRVNFKCHS